MKSLSLICSVLLLSEFSSSLSSATTLIMPAGRGLFALRFSFTSVSEFFVRPVTTVLRESSEFFRFNLFRIIMGRDLNSCRSMCFTFTNTV